MSEKAELASGWIDVEFGELFSRPTVDIVDGPFGSNLKASEYVADGVPIVRLQNIDRNRFVSKNIQYVSERKATELTRHTFVPGDLLITKLGDPLGKACIAPIGIAKGVLVADVVRARITHSFVDSRFVAYQINSGNFIDQFKDQTKGTTRPRVNLTKIRALRARVCPLAEQTRIVEKLDELFADLDAGVAELKAAQRKLAQYRHSLLMAAVEGALTADWRASRSAASVDSGDELLARILRERRARWEGRQLAKFKEQGRTPPKDWQTKYPEPVASSTNLPALPQGWVWASLDQLTEFITSGSRGWADYYAEQGATFIRSQNINKDWLDLSDTAFVNPPPSSEGARTLVRTGDLLLTITGANVGKAARVDIDLEEAYVSQHVALIRLVDATLGVYVHLFLTAEAGGRGQLNKEAYGAGKPGLNLRQVGSVAVPLPSSQEVVALMQALSAQFSAVQTQSLEIAHSLKQSAFQRKNLLQAAFSGHLVPQDPADEPASVLLERIRTERAARRNETKTRVASTSQEVQ